MVVGFPPGGNNTVAVAPGFGEVRAVEINRRLAEAAEEPGTLGAKEIGTLWELADMFRLYNDTRWKHTGSWCSCNWKSTVIQSYSHTCFEASNSLGEPEDEQDHELRMKWTYWTILHATPQPRQK